MKSRGLLRLRQRQDPEGIYGFVAAEKANHSIKVMCRVLGVSRSGYFAWATRPPSPRAVADERLTRRISRKRVARLMKHAGISGLQEKKYRTTTIRVPGVRVADDLLDRDFTATAPNQKWRPTSRTCGRGRGGCTSSLCRTPTAAESSGGASLSTCAPSS